MSASEQPETNPFSSRLTGGNFGATTPIGAQASLGNRSPIGNQSPFAQAGPWWMQPQHAVAAPADPFGAVCSEHDASCQGAVERLYFFLDGELTADRRAVVQQHLDRCPSCFHAFGFEAQLRTMVRSSMMNSPTEPVPDSLLSRIHQALTRDSSESSVQPPSITFPAPD